MAFPCRVTGTLIHLGCRPWPEARDGAAVLMGTEEAGEGAVFSPEQSWVACAEHSFLAAAEAESALASTPELRAQEGRGATDGGCHGDDPVPQRVGQAGDARSAREPPAVASHPFAPMGPDGSHFSPHSPRLSPRALTSLVPHSKAKGPKGKEGPSHLPSAGGNGGRDRQTRTHSTQPGPGRPQNVLFFVTDSPDSGTFC